MQRVIYHLKSVGARISFAVVFAALFFVSPSLTLAANIYFSPTSGTQQVGTNFSVSVYVSSTDQPMNAISGVVKFPVDTLQVVSISKTNSIISLWVQEPSFSNSQGTVNLEGVVLNPGFTGASGRILTITFKPKVEGSASVGMSSASVLANDGNGTNILANIGSAEFTIKTASAAPVPAPAAPAANSSSDDNIPVIVSATHPDQNSWYSLKDASFSWKTPKGTTGVRMLIGKIEKATPTVTYDGDVTSKDINNIEDGTSYFHVRFKEGSVWGPTGHFRIRIDTEKPKFFDIKEVARNDLTDPIARFKFDAQDETSGIDRYEIKIDNNLSEDWKDDGSGIYKTKPLPPGKHLIVVKALDKAGNYLANSVEFNIDGLEKPVISDYPSEIEENKDFVIKGKSIYPNAPVKIYFKEGTEIKTVDGIKTDSTGGFEAAISNKFKRATYSVYAIVVDSRGAETNPSDSVEISIVQGILFRVGNFAVSILTILVPLVGLLVLLAFILWFAWYKFNTFRKNLQKEVHEAESSLHKTFDVLREDIREHIKLLENARSKRELTREEEKIIKQLRKDLDDAERFVKKEIKDIENLKFK